MSHPRGFGALGISACLALLLGTNTARADANPAQRATAEALFQQGTRLMDEQHFDEACEKFAASQELDAGLGTMLYLADCYEQAGKTASSWALFREAADAARRAQQPDREHIATERATSLEARLSKLELRVPRARQVDGLELRLNDSPIPSASWNVPMPIDPGVTRIEARAPGKTPWQVRIDLAQGPASQVVEVPRLAEKPRARASEATETASNSVPPPGHSTQRTMGYVVGTIGAVALAAGGFFGYRAYYLNNQSKGDCRANAPNACTPEGVATREDARTAGSISTITTAAGATLLTAGLTLIFTAPTPPSARAGHTAPNHASGAIVGLEWRGAW